MFSVSAALEAGIKKTGVRELLTCRSDVPLVTRLGFEVSQLRSRGLQIKKLQSPATRISENLPKLPACTPARPDFQICALHCPAPLQPSHTAFTLIFSCVLAHSVDAQRMLFPGLSRVYIRTGCPACINHACTGTSTGRRLMNSGRHAHTDLPSTAPWASSHFFSCCFGRSLCVRPTRLSSACFTSLNHITPAMDVLLAKFYVTGCLHPSRQRSDLRVEVTGIGATDYAERCK